MNDLSVALLAKEPQNRPESATVVYTVLLNLATVELPELPRTPQDRSAADPTSPYHFPFGPLPRDSVAGTRLVAAQASPRSIPSFDELQEVRSRAIDLIDEQ